jgi:uncharacterized damage-inducible protein DinB
VKSLPIIVSFAENNAWANDRLYAACSALTQAELVAPRTSFFPTLRKTLSHNLIVDWFYVDCLEGGTLGYGAFEKDEPVDAFEPLREAQREVDMRLVRFCVALPDEGALDAKVSLPRPSGTKVETAGKVLLHLFQHQIHHRGQAHAMLAGTHVKPPQLDEFFLDEDRALRAEELRRLGLPVR